MNEKFILHLMALMLQPKVCMMIIPTIRFHT